MRSLRVKSISKLKKKGVNFRNRVIHDSSNLSKLLVSKSLSLKLVSSGGRNESGRITTRHRGGGHKRRLRYIDYIGGCSYYSDRLSYLSLEYDSNRSVLISRVVSGTLCFSYRLGLDGIVLGTDLSKDSLGRIVRLKEIRLGSLISSIDGKYCRSAGTFGQLLQKENGLCLVRLSSKETKWFSEDCRASLGVNGRESHKLLKKGKAGASRWLGRRPIVRGCAQNAVDHPNGGKTRGGGQPKTKWGKQAKWFKFLKS